MHREISAESLLRFAVDTAMSAEQRELYEHRDDFSDQWVRDRIYRMPVGLFRCPECPHAHMWEWPLGLYEGTPVPPNPGCPICLEDRKPLLVEVARDGGYAFVS
jgi:hypothetical protein